jgi:hypothetical protein
MNSEHILLANLISTSGAPVPFHFPRAPTVPCMRGGEEVIRQSAQGDARVTTRRYDSAHQRGYARS